MPPKDLPEDVPTIADILADYIDVTDPFYESMIDALKARELSMTEDAVERFKVKARKKFVEQLDKLVNL